MNRRRSSSMRWKILGSIMVPVTLLLVVLTGAISALVISDKAQEIDEHLSREALELSLLAEKAIDPRSGDSITDPRALLELYITRTIPDPNETMFVVADGLAFARTTDTPPVRLDLDADFMNLVNGANDVVFGDWETSAGNARYVIVPVLADNSSGALVAIIFSDADSAPIRELVIRFALIALFALLGMLAVGYLVAGRIFAPIKSLTEFAKQLGEDKLGERIPVGDKRDELDSLALEFNRMLDRLEDAFRSQRQFVDVAGHELRTPLTIIRGHFDLMKADPAEAKTAIPIIQDELERMARLVGDLQALTKSGSPEFVKAGEVDLGAFSEELRSKISSMTKRKVEFHPASGTCRMDSQRISQATLQLVENALRYIPKSAKIRVAIQSGVSELEIIVEDSGPGVEPELQEKIFEPFVRGKGKQNIDGSGIGLSLVRAIAQAHGGTAEVNDSSLGGAMFVIRIPR